MAPPVKVSRGPRRPAVRQACPFVGGMRGVSPETDTAMPKKQTTAGKKARAAARGGEKYTTALRRLFLPGTSPAAAPYGSGTDSAHPVSLEHRSLLDHPPGFRTFRGTELFERIGGQSTIDRLVDLLYEGIGDDDQLRPLFPRDLAGSRSMQKLFFAEWLGGPRRYSEQAHAGLRHSHDGLPITPAIADRWLGHFHRAMVATVAAENDRSAIFVQARSLAMALVSGQVAPARPPGRGDRPGGKDVRGGESKTGPRPVAWCGIGARSVARARDLAHRGDAAGLGAALAEAPDLLRPSYAAAILQAAALAGRAEIVRMLLDRGVGMDHPFYLPVGVTGVAFERVVFVTPLCAARMKRRSAVESLLLAAGAHEDVFTSAFLGDLTALAPMLTADPSLAQATDPAVDVLDITPVEHAVAGRQASALRLILDHVAHPLPGYVRALRGAAAQGSLATVELLLAHGADATRIGSDAGSFIPNSLRCWPAVARRSTPPARGSVPAARETRVARTIRSMSAPSCTTVPARTTAGPATRKVRPASGLLMRRRFTTPPGQGSSGPSRYSSSTEQTQTPATVTAARRLTGWNKRHRQCREPRSGT
jgi:truncated hemoglobin YjbI